jgi:lipopolysaccharide export system protein LptA
MNCRFALIAGLLGAALFGSAPALAQGLDLSHGGPIQVEARDGIDWIQGQQEVIARGDARAIRGNVTVTADTLIAHYRKKASANTPATGDAGGSAIKPAAATSAGSPPTTVDDTSGNEVYRLEATGHVHIFTPTDQAWGDHAVYDIDQAVLVLTGHNLKLTTPKDILTSKDDMEYWSQTRIAIARGDAVAISSDGRRISADTLVGYITQPNQQPANAAGKPKPAAANDKSTTPDGKPAQDPLMASGKLQRVEAFGNVDVRTATETIYGDRGVYVPDTGKARIVGHVRITRGQNQVNGVAADVDMKTGVSTLLSGPKERVAGMIMPNDAQAATQGNSANPKGAKPGQGNAQANAVGKKQGGSNSK